MGDGEREVVTEEFCRPRACHLLEEIAADGRAAAPAEVFRVTTKHGDHGSIQAAEVRWGKRCCWE